MIGWRLELNAVVGFAERQRNLVRRYWTWELVWFFYSLVSVLSIGYLASGLGSLGLGVSRTDLHAAQIYLLVGSLLWGYLSMVFVEVSLAISWERWAGTIEYTFMAPVRRASHLVGICVFAILYGLVRSAAVLLVAVVAFHLDLEGADLPAAVAVLVAATVPLTGLGIITSVLPLISPEKGEQMTFATVVASG